MTDQTESGRVLSFLVFPFAAMKKSMVMNLMLDTSSLDSTNYGMIPALPPCRLPRKILQNRDIIPSMIDNGTAALSRSAP